MAETKGILGRKVGMTQVFEDSGRAVPVTVVQAGPCFVTQVKTPETDGYTAVQLAYGVARRTTKPLAGHYAKSGVEPARHLVEMRVDDDELEDYPVGTEIKADVFEVGDVVDVIGVTKGKGFAGVMKRHGFKGLPASHGAHRVHRSPGAIGACATPARVFKGTRMAGRMGAEKVTTQNVEIIQADAERKVLLVKGAVPGPKGGLVIVRNATKVLVEDAGRAS